MTKNESKTEGNYSSYISFQLFIYCFYNILNFHLIIFCSLIMYLLHRYAMEGALPPQDNRDAREAPRDNRDTPRDNRDTPRDNRDSRGPEADRDRDRRDRRITPPPETTASATVRIRAPLLPLLCTADRIMVGFCAHVAQLACA